MSKLTKDQAGFSIVETAVIVLVIILLGVAGLVTYKHHQKKPANQTVATHTEVKTSSSPSKTSVPPMNFYDCVAQNGTLAQSGSATCTLDGKTYAFTTVFTADDIVNYDKVPSTAQPLVYALARRVFDACAQEAVSGATNGAYPHVDVYISSGSFVYAAVNNCDSGYSEAFGLQNGKWVDLGGSQDGLSCDYVSAYGITLSDILPGTMDSELTVCTDASGKNQSIPA